MFKLHLSLISKFRPIIISGLDYAIASYRHIVCTSVSSNPFSQSDKRDLLIITSIIRLKLLMASHYIQGKTQIPFLPRKALYDLHASP